jgi:membrane protein required for colicin V production
MLFGLARGVLLAAVAVITLQVAGVTDEPWWQQSKLIPYAAPVADALRKAAKQGLGQSRSPSVSGMTDVPVGPFRLRSR